MNVTQSVAETADNDTNCRFPSVRRWSWPQLRIQPNQLTGTAIIGKSPRIGEVIVTDANRGNEVRWLRPGIRRSAEAACRLRAQDKKNP